MVGSVVSARRHAVSAELIGAGNEVRDRGILITESNQFHETMLATPRRLKEQTVPRSLSFSVSLSLSLFHALTLSSPPPLPPPFGISSYELRQRSNQMHRIKLI